MPGRGGSDGGFKHPTSGTELWARVLKEMDIGGNDKTMLTTLNDYYRLSKKSSAVAFWKMSNDEDRAIDKKIKNNALADKAEHIWNFRE